MLSSTRKAIITAVTAGLIGVAASLPTPMLDLDEFLGLKLLYGLRGKQTAPASVVIIGIDETSGDELALDADPSEWQRSAHTALLDVLTTAGAQYVGYDVWFGDPRDAAQDRALALAVGRVPSIVMLDWLERREHGTIVPTIVDTRRRPLPEIAAAADATAPFHLTERPVLKNQYWAFPPSADGAPTLPVVLFALYAEYAVRTLERGLEAFGRAPVPGLSVEASLRGLREALQQDGALVAALEAWLAEAEDPMLDASTRRHARTLLDIVAGGESRYLNLYGPARSIRTLSIQDVLARGLPADLVLEETAIFVGYSNTVASGEQDQFLSVYSDPLGRDLSGVEILATAFANLLDGTMLSPLPVVPHALIVLAFGLALGAAAMPRSAATAAGLVVVLSILYVAAAEWRFSEASRWWPVVVPLLTQAPTAMLLVLLLRYREERSRGTALSRGASLYLPSELVERIAASPAGAMRASELIVGTCMATDLEGFTKLSERMPPRELEARLNSYYDGLFRIVSRHGGIVTDIVGDSMVAIWRDTADSVERASAALEAAAEIGTELGAAIGDFPRTRVGLNAGEFMLGTVGAEQHLEYRAVGDVVNSAARVQALNKRLGTTILATRAAVPSGAAIARRNVGCFQLEGKSEALEIHELLWPRLGAGSPEWLLRFDAGLLQFRQGRWDEAAEAFLAALAERPDDGVSRFYLGLTELMAAQPLEPSWNGVVRVDG